jgi:hypothetical protein
MENTVKGVYSLRDSHHRARPAVGGGRSAGLGGRAMKKLLLCVSLLSFLALALVVTSPASATKRQAWTVMVYLDGDNNLDEWGWFNLDQMGRGLTSGRDVTIVVLYDHAGDTGAEKWLVVPGGRRLLASVPEPDMGSPATLASFAAWAMETYPADKYVLDLWDHGRGWAYFASDDTSGGRMMIPDLASAMAKAEKAAGEKIDLTAFDGCSMAMIELSYQLRTFTDVLVASQQVVPLEGFPYEPIVRSLVACPGQSAADLGRVIVDSYASFYLDELNASTTTVTLSSIDETRQAPLSAAYDRLAGALLNGVDVWKAKIGSAAAVSEHQVYGWGLNGSLRFIDSHRFAQEIARRIDDPGVDRAAADLASSLSSALYERHSPQQDGHSYGLSVSFPSSQPQYDFVNWLRYDYAGIGLDFPAETLWDELLLGYYKGKRSE